MCLLIAPDSCHNSHSVCAALMYTGEGCSYTVDFAEPVKFFFVASQQFSSLLTCIDKSDDQTHTHTHNFTDSTKFTMLMNLHACDPYFLPTSSAYSPGSPGRTAKKSGPGYHLEKSIPQLHNKDNDPFFNIPRQLHKIFQIFFRPGSGSFVRDNVEDLTSSGLVRRPLLVSSTSSTSDTESVVDLTNESTSLPRQSSTHRPNVLIIDSDEEIVEMELPTPPQTNRHRNLNPRRDPSNSRSTRADDECFISKTMAKQGQGSNEARKSSEPSPSSDATKCVYCPVCMETAQQIEKDGRRLMVTRCGHIFCNVCINKAVQVKRKCPTCRKAVPQSSYHPLFLS